VTATITLDEIPGPRGLPVLGNARAVDADAPFESLLRLADEYGPIYRLVVPGGTRLIVTGPELMDELCDDARYDKKVTGGQAALRGAMGTSGLFTSDTQDPMWHRAHNILMARSGLGSIRAKRSTCRPT
jgi:cytochrome P450/NADPH-cytochrome P450 reductase